MPPFSFLCLTMLCSGEALFFTYHSHGWIVLSVCSPSHLRNGLGLRCPRWGLAKRSVWNRNTVAGVGSG